MHFIYYALFLKPQSSLQVTTYFKLTFLLNHFSTHYLCTLCLMHSLLKFQCTLFSRPHSKNRFFYSPSHFLIGTIKHQHQLYSINSTPALYPFWTLFLKFYYIYIQPNSTITTLYIFFLAVYIDIILSCA